jgi:hypothetical protein
MNWDRQRQVVVRRLANTSAEGSIIRGATILWIAVCIAVRQAGQVSIIRVDVKVRGIQNEIPGVNVAASGLASRLRSKRDVDTHVVTVNYTFVSLS